MPFRGRKKAFDHRLGDAGLDVGSLDQALVAHESPAAAGEDRGPAREACQVLLAPAGGRTSDPAAVRRHVAADLGAAGAGRLTRGTGNAVRLAKKWPPCGAVSEKCRENRASSRPHVTTG